MDRSGNASVYLPVMASSATIGTSEQVIAAARGSVVIGPRIAGIDVDAGRDRDRARAAPTWRRRRSSRNRLPRFRCPVRPARARPTSARLRLAGLGVVRRQTSAHAAVAAGNAHVHQTFVIERRRGDVLAQVLRDILAEFVLPKHLSGLLIESEQAVTGSTRPDRVRRAPVCGCPISTPNTIPSPSATPRLALLSGVFGSAGVRYSQIRLPVFASSAKMSCSPVVMYITPSLTTGVPCCE